MHLRHQQCYSVDNALILVVVDLLDVDQLDYIVALFEISGRNFHPCDYCTCAMKMLLTHAVELLTKLIIGLRAALGDIFSSSPTLFSSQC